MNIEHSNSNFIVVLNTNRTREVILISKKGVPVPLWELRDNNIWFLIFVKYQNLWFNQKYFAFYVLFQVQIVLRYRLKSQIKCHLSHLVFFEISCWIWIVLAVIYCKAGSMNILVPLALISNIKPNWGIRSWVLWSNVLPFFISLK